MRLRHIILFVWVFALTPACAEPEQDLVDWDSQPNSDDSESTTVNPSVPPSGGGTDTGADTDGVIIPGTGAGRSGDPCDEQSDCAVGYSCWKRVCVGEGQLRFSLSWTLETDLDLHVETPGGYHLFFADRIGAGGELDVDDCVGEVCASPGQVHVENIYFSESAVPGTYRYWVHNYAGQMATEYTLEVYVAGELQESLSGTVPASQVNSTLTDFSYGM